MLSILQRQAKVLEAEKKDREKECLTLRHQKEELQATVKARDERIEILEAELAALQAANSDAEAAILEASDAEKGGAKSESEELNSERLSELTKLVDELKAKLDSCQGKLTFSELRVAMLDLEKCSQNVSHVSIVMKLEKQLEELRGQLERARKAKNVGEQTELELKQLKADICRRDEQLEFLLHVHEASSGYDWVNDQQQRDQQQLRRVESITPWSGEPPPHILQAIAAQMDDTGHKSLSRNQGVAVGAGGIAASLLGGTSDRTMHADPVAALEDLGISTADAIAALEETGGDMDRAVLSLFPVE
jgi:DNA repair exonuclease SbcCD ATPase subunit